MVARLGSILALVFIGSFGCQSTPSGAAPPAPTEPAPVPTEAPTTEPTTPPPTEPKLDPPPAGNVKTMFVKDKLVDCVGEGPMKCMSVRQGQEGEFLLFYSPIEGFTFEEGFTYELEVEITDDPNPPADASSKRYRLVELVSKTKVQ